MPSIIVLDGLDPIDKENSAQTHILNTQLSPLILCSIQIFLFNPASITVPATLSHKNQDPSPISLPHRRDVFFDQIFSNLNSLET